MGNIGTIRYDGSHIAEENSWWEASKQRRNHRTEEYFEKPVLNWTAEMMNLRWFYAQCSHEPDT